MGPSTPNGAESRFDIREDPETLPVGGAGVTVVIPPEPVEAKSIGGFSLAGAPCERLRAIHFSGENAAGTRNFLS